MKESDKRKLREYKHILYFLRKEQKRVKEILDSVWYTNKEEIKFYKKQLSQITLNISDYEDLIDELEAGE